MNLENNIKIDVNNDEEELLSKIYIESRIKELKDLLAKGGNESVSKLDQEKRQLEAKLERKEYV